ncbi:SMC family ATPase [bacterium]|nr:SMC family ATPase [bacterium]
MPHPQTKAIPRPDASVGLKALQGIHQRGSILGALEVMHREVGDVFRLPVPGFNPVVLAGPKAARFVLATARDDIMRLGEKVEEYKRRQEALNQQRTREQAAYGRLTNADQALEALDHLVERKATLLRERDDLRDQESLYEDLKHAFGKNGIPAMMIDAAAPELETEANTLLSRMTDGRMHLRISTQREKATGGTVESLTLEIADELGTRSYELYSGGEAFRINFAVRVALSKMLARRAGAHLRTLFIDEGFGTQDEAGRNKLVEAITAIQDDFDLILVITHIDDLRDSFPVHIVVDKGGGGSSISIR